MAIILAQEDPKPKNPKITVASSTATDIQPQTGSAISENYTKGFVPFLESQKNYVAGQQGGAAEFGNMLGQSVLGALTGTVETMAYWGDLDERIGNRFREQKEYENWLGNLMKEAKEAGKLQMPIYKTEDNEQFHPESREWWMANGGDTIGSVLGLMVPGLAVSKLGKLAGLGEAGQAISAAVASRTAESTMEANDAFQTAYATAKQQGLSEEDARAVASRAGAKTWDSNWVFALQDVMQFSALTKGMKTAAKGMKGQTIKNILGFLGNAASEGAEEGGQYIVSQEAQNAALHTQEDYFGKDFSKRLTDYVDDEEFKTSVTLGAVGGAVFQGAGDLAGKPLEYVANKINNIARRGLQREQANSIDDTATSQKTTNIDAADQIVDRINKGKLNEYLDELDEQIKQPNITAEGRENVQNQIQDTKELLTEESKLKNSNIPKEMHKPILLRQLEKNQLNRLDKQLTKEVNTIHQSLTDNEELPEGLGELKKLQTTAVAYKQLANETKNPEIQKKAELLEANYNKVLEETKQNPLIAFAIPDIGKALTTTKDNDLNQKTYQLIATKEKHAAIVNELKDLNTPAGKEKLAKAVATQKEVNTTKEAIKKKDITPAEVQAQMEKVQSPEAHSILQSKLDQLKQDNQEANKQKVADVIDHATDEHINPEVNVNPEISPEYEVPIPTEEYQEPDLDPFADIDPSTLAAFGQVKPQEEVLEKISTEQEKKEPKPSKKEAQKAEKIKNEYLETQTGKTWFKEFQSTKTDGVYTLLRDAEGYPIEQEYYNKKGERVPAHKVFASDNHGIPLVDTPLVKEGDHVLLKHENEFEYTFTPGFKPTSFENQIINVYWVNEDGSLRHDKPLNQLPSSDNEQLTAEQREINTKLRDQVIKEGGQLRTKIISKNIGEAKRGDKLNTLGILEFDYYNNQFQKLPFNPILGAVDKNGNITFSGDTAARASKDYKDKLENLSYFPLTDTKAGSVVVARQAPNGSLRVEILNERQMNDQEIKYTQEEIGKAFTTEDFTNLDQVFFLPNHSTGVYRDTDARTKRSKKPDLFKLDRTRIHRIQNQLAIPIVSGKLQGWAVVEKRDIPNFLESKNSNIKRYWWQGGKMVKMTTNMSEDEQKNIRKIFDTLSSNKQRNISHEKLNSELPYFDPATGETHKNYYEFLKATNALQTKLRGSLTPASGQDTSYSYGQTAIYLDPNQKNLEVSVTPEGEINVVKDEPLAPAANPLIDAKLKEIERLKAALGNQKNARDIGTSLHDYNAGIQREITKRENEIKSLKESKSTEGPRKPSFAKKKYKLAITPNYKFKTLGDKELAWFQYNYGNEFLQIAENVDRFVAANGKEAFGVYYSALVSVAEYANEGTIYHEAGHFVFDPANKLISEKMREKVLDEASKVYNIPRSYDQLSNPELQEPLEAVPSINGKQKVFVYGTLMNDATRKEALGESSTAVPSKVLEAGRANVMDYPDIAPAAGQDLDGKVLDLTPEQIAKLDKWEADYNRQVVKLSTGERAFVYNMKPSKLNTNVVDNELTGDQLLEERLMDDFETYKISDGKYVPEVKSVQSFFAKLLAIIKKLLGFKSPIEKLYEKIDAPNINKFQREELVANRLLTNNGELKFKLAPGFINSEQEADAILSFKTEAMNIIYAAVQKINQVGNVLTQPGRLGSILEEVRAKFRTEGLRISSKPITERSQEEIDRLATLWATGVLEGTPIDEDNLSYVGTWNDNQYGEFVDKGFKSKVIESLSDLGFVVKVNADLLELAAEDEAERLYDIDHTLLNPSNSISNRVKLLLHSIPQPTLNKEGQVIGYEKTHLGTIKPLDFRAVDARLALKLADSLNPYTRLTELSKVDPIAKVILDKLNDIKAKGDKQTFKEVLVKYRRDTVDKKTILHKTERKFIPLQERGPDGNQYYDQHTSSLIDSNRGSVFRSIIGDWREEAVRTNFITHNDTVTNKIIAVNNMFSKLKAGRTTLTSEEIKNQFKAILKEMGIETAPEMWKELDGMSKKDKALQLNTWIFGKQARSLESLLDDIHANNESPFSKETGTVLEDLAKASAVYNNRVKTGAYLNDNGELEYPINLPSYLSEINNIFNDKDLTHEFIEKHLQDDFYTKNKFLQVLGDPKLGRGIKLSLLSAVRDRDRDVKMFADRTEIDSVLSRFTAYSSNNEVFSNFFIGTTADKAKNAMMSLPRKKGADAKAFLMDTLEGTIDSELVRIGRKGGNFLYVPELNSVPNLKASLDKGEISPEEYTEARKQASKVLDTFIETNYNQFLNFLVENDIISINDKGSITNKRIPKGVLNKSTPEAFLKEFFYNDTAWRLEMSKVFMGDFAFYKGQTDYFKRAYQLVTPGYKGFLLPEDSTTITRGIYPKQMKLNSPEVNSLIALGLSKETAGIYAKGVNKTDAQSVATIHGYRKLADSIGLWSPEHEQVYNYAWGKGLTAREGLFNAERNGLITKDERLKLLQVKLQALKPFQFNDKETKNNGKVVLIKEQYKDSITPIIPELFNGQSGYSDLHEFMMAHGFDVMSAEDTVKVGLSDVVDFSQPVEDRHRKVVKLEDIRYPQLLPEASKEEVSGTQMHKLVMGDINDATIYDFRGKKISGAQIKELYHKVWEQKIREASESLQKKLGVDSTFTLSTDPIKRKEQFIKLQLMLKEELSTRDLNENYQDALELARTQFDTIDFSLPLSFPQLGEKFQGILTNVFKKKIFKEGTKTNGISAVNLADYGVGRTDELKYIRDEKGQITEAEVGLPLDNIKSVGLKAVEHYDPKTMRIYWDKLNENQKKALQYIIYRIPTSNKSSMLPVRVAMITPSHLNNIVMIPGELTLQMGLDFDVDKSQLISRVLTDGRVDRDAADSRLFDIYWSVLTNKAHLNAMLTPLTTTRLEDIRDKYKELGILTEESSSPFFTIQADAKAESKNREEKVKVGIASRAATAHSVFNSIPAELLNSERVVFGLDTQKKEQLGKGLDDSGTLVSENLGVVQQAALDAAKTPLLALFNITKNLLPAAETYLLFGKNLDTVTDFFMQPVVREWSKAYVQNNEKDRKAFSAITTEYPELGKLYQSHLHGAHNQFSPEDLKKGLTTKLGDNPAMEARVLAELHYLLNLSKQVSNLTNVVSLETMNDAGSIEALLVVQNQVNQATSDKNDVYMDATLFNPQFAPKHARRLASFYKHGILDGINYAGQFYPATSPSYRIARQNIMETLRLHPNVELYKKINQFTNYYALQGDSKLHQALTASSPTKKGRQWSYVDDDRSFFNHIQNMIKKYPALLENELIKNLRDESSMRAEMSQVGVRNTDDNSKTEVIGAWHDLLSANNEEVRQLGHDLIRYSIFTSGFMYHTSSFVDLVPLDFWAKSGLDNVWKDSINNPHIDQEALLLDFVRHKYNSIKGFPEFYLDYKNNSKAIVKSSIKQNAEGVITSFVVNEDLYNESNFPPRFVTVRGSLYENNPANFVHYRLLQPAGSRYLYEVSADGRKESIHPDNKGLGSPNPFKVQDRITSQGVTTQTVNSTVGEVKASIPQNLISGISAYGTTQIAKPEIKQILGDKPHSIDMIAAGLRTRTTRSVGEMEKYNIKVGDTIKHFGLSSNGKNKTVLAIVTAIHPKGTPGFLGTWFKEGWTEEGKKYIERFKDGAAAIEFKVIDDNNPQSIQFPLLVNIPEGQNEFINDYLPEASNSPEIVLKKLIAEETNEQTLQTLHTLQASINKLTIPIERGELGSGQMGRFKVTPLSNGTFTTSITLNSNMNVESASQMRSVITHELVHAFTVGVLSNPQTEAEKSFKRNVERLAAETGLSNYEFIAELASDPAFRAKVQKKGIWATIIRLIRKVLGQKEEYDKVLDQMYDVIDHVESLQQFEPGAFYKAQEEKEEKKEPKKRLDALEKALSSLNAQERKLREKGDKTAADILSVHIDQLKKLSSTNRSQAVVKYLLIVDSQMKALKRTYDEMAKAPNKINPKILNPMRDQLLSYSLLDTFSNEVHNNPEAFVPTGGDSTQLLKAIADLKNDVYSLKAKTNSLVINRVAEAVNEALGGKENIEELRENLQVADRDINWWSRMETSFSEIRDKFIKAAALMFKEVKYKAYRQSQEDLYRDTVKKETASIAVHEDKWVRRTISFNSIGMFKALNNYEAWMKQNGKDAGSLADKFAPFINKESLKQDSKGIEFVAPWSKEGKEILKLGESNPVRQFYETFVLGYLKSQEKIKLPSMRPGLRIPTIGRTLLEGFLKEKGLTNKMDVLHEQFTNSFIERFDDAEYQQVNQHGQPQSGLPLRYTSRQDGEEGRLTKKEVSLDIASTVGLFMFEMNKREGMLAVQDDLELLEQSMAERKVMKTKRAGSYLSGETRGIPLANGEYATINGVESNAYAAFKDLMDRELYGITKKREGDLKIGQKKVSIAKGVDAFMRFTGLRIMLGKVAIPLTNLLVSELTLAKEIIGGNILSAKNWKAGQKFYTANAFKVLADLGKRQKETHLGKLLTFFNPMEVLPAVGHIGVDSTRMRTVWDKVISTGGSTAEYKMAVTAFGAVMDKFNVINKEGKLESLDKGVEISNAGKITLKAGYKYAGKEGTQYEKGKSEMSDKDINQVIHYTLRTYQIMNGIYNIGDKPAANAYVVGRLANFMRSWLPAGIATRWNTKDFDQRLGQTTEGHYISALIALKNVYGKDGMLMGTLKNLKMLMWMGNNNPETLLLPEELALGHEEKQELINMRKAGMRKTLFELYGIAALGVLIFATFGDDDDSYTKYMLARVRRELMTFIDPTTAWDVLRSPTVALNTIETFAGFISTARESVWAYASGEDQPMMERGPGKGMTKIGYKAKRLFGVDADMQFDDMGSKSRIILNGGFK